MGFLAAIEKEVHGSPATSPCDITVTGLTAGNQMVLYVLQGATYGGFATITSLGDWTVLATNGLAVSMDYRAYLKTFDPDTDGTVSIAFTGGTPVLVAALIVAFDDLGTFEQALGASGATSTTGTTALSLYRYLMCWYRPYEITPATGMVDLVQTDFSGQLGASGLVVQDLDLEGPGSLSQYTLPNGDVTSASRGLIFATVIPYGGGNWAWLG